MNELDALRALADPGKAEQMLAYHKAPRTYLGVANRQIDDLVAEWRAALDPDGRVALASALWDSDLHEARIAAAKLLVQARIRPDDAVWSLIAAWVPDFDGWAIADTAMIAGQKRLVADPGRLDQVETWLDHPNKWTRRAALVGTLPWAKMNNPKADDLAQRERVLDWAARLAEDRDWFIQKAIAWWLRDLSKRDAPRVRAFLADHGARMKPFARKEAARLVQER
ncbi:DNA alkylation repair protein [Paracoccus benzoatiresistens]|uniref:DNA alkylation repair protein n=1 Tax=Paracoccus benzoatiresistens TaxID=2997341 RepID=A0ABT4J734_9RHOB|nr:DNA alkylation repair protein [Paracoccus sp. EF6]MCZ0962709.1 DNA alkylation repair protein [Paracoccus sp. EF6]